MDWHGLDWSGSDYNHMAGCCECGNEPSGSIKCGECLDRGPVSFSRRAPIHGIR